MATFKTPGVYVQEISKLPASVAQVATAVPAFMGYTENAVTNPVRIKSMVDFESIFGGPYSRAITIAIDESVSPATFVATEDATYKYKLYFAMQMYFANGGGPCYVVSTGTYGTAKLDTHYTHATTGALAKLKKEDEPTILVACDAWDLGNYYEIQKACLSQCNTLQDRFTVIDVIGTDMAAFRAGVGTQFLKYGAGYYPNLKTTLSYPDTSVYLTHVGGTAALDSKTLAQLKIDALDIPTNDDIAEALVNLEGKIRETIAKQVIVLPPSAAMAGIYCTVDANRGVWKAPANISLNAVSEPIVKIDDKEQEDLNVSDTGKSINAIRTFVGKGVLVWGARTLDGNSNEWRYINVRRLFITAEESIKKATEFVVFEGNDANTWNKVKAMIENYLTGLWKDGALAGAKADEAFYVNVGLGSTMTAQDILEGRLIVEIGMAAVRPAEFIILNFSHKLQTS